MVGNSSRRFRPSPCQKTPFFKASAGRVGSHRRARATPYLSCLAIDRFMTGGKRTNVSQFFFNDCHSNRRGKSAQKGKN